MADTRRRVLPASTLEWVLLGCAVASWFVILRMIYEVLKPTLLELDSLGSHDWDQMESHRYLATKTILAYHQFPFWNPYACGGHPNWGGFESGTNIVSPWAPFYLTMTLAHALRVEVWGSALLSALGAWLLAGRFTKSSAARALVVVAFAVNGRWTLQMSTGHTWHLAYGLMPWALYFFDRAVGTDPARGPPRAIDTVLCAATIALMVYTGGIYPVPHTVVALGLYALFHAALDRTDRPLLVTVGVLVLAFGLAAPKLLPVIEVIGRYPRIVDSNESMDLTALVQILTSHDQDIYSRPAAVNAKWGWHEFGMYIGWTTLLVVLAGSIFGRGTRESPLKWVGLIFVVLGFGAFDLHAPWPLLHRFPVFKSQHVPSRWLYPALLCLLTVAAAFMERVLRRTGRLRAWLEIALVLMVSKVATDVGEVAAEPVPHAFTVQMPPTVHESTGPFHTTTHLPPELTYTVDYVAASLTAEMANVGTIDCSTFPGLNQFTRDPNGRVAGLGAHGADDPAYRGEAYIADGVGQAAIEKWTPNEMTVRIRGAQAGEHVVLNQNWDPNWTANGARALNWSDQVSAEVHGHEGTVVFRYLPRYFWPGVALFALTSAGILAWLRQARAKRSASPREELS